MKVGSFRRHDNGAIVIVLLLIEYGKESYYRLYIPDLFSWTSLILFRYDNLDRLSKNENGLVPNPMLCSVFYKLKMAHLITYTSSGLACMQFGSWGLFGNFPFWRTISGKNLESTIEYRIRSIYATVFLVFGIWNLIILVINLIVWQVVFYWYRK